GSVTTDFTEPVITTITSDATASGVLKVDDTILFTLTPASTEPNATVSGTYNSVGLSWSTADAGVTYTATYTVAEGDNDQDPALQITGVTIEDEAGNLSAAADGSDVIKTIDANSPKLLSAVGTNSGIADLFNAVNDQLDLLFSEAINATPSESDSEMNFIFSGTDGDNFPTEVGGQTIIAIATTTVTDDTISYTFSTGDTANVNLIEPGTTLIDVYVNNVVADSIEDLAGNDLLDTSDGNVILITTVANSPNAPTLVSPDDAGYVNDTTPTVTWNIPSDPNGDNLHFIVYFDTVNTFNSGALKIFDSAISSTGFSGVPPYTEGVGTANYTVQAGYALSQTTWYWRVVAKDHPDNFISAPSSTWSMVIDTTAPLLDSVVVAAGNATAEVTF
ncbi:MAG: hypothetical protein KAS66_16165, partial [Candidatus Omnitrophica bacterium]|nr:hypothetical protein [Candidatus Omnitrophota bacterium]